MKLSFYTKTYPYKEKPGYLLLYSTKKAASVLLEESLFRRIDEGTLSSEEEKTLSRLGFLVRDVREEKREMEGILEKVNRQNTQVNAIVVLNLDCNLACPYCFEGKLKGMRYMSSETADRLVDFFAGELLPGMKSLGITFYGGEPLLSMDHIQNISTRLKAEAEKQGVEFAFSMVTNGTLLTRKKAEALVPLGLKRANITLDGPGEHHNRSRPYKNGGGSYEKILRNIKESCDIVSIQLTGNYTRENYRDFPLLLDALLKEGLTPEKIPMVRFCPVTKTGGTFALPDYKGGCESSKEPWLQEADLFLREEILKKGFYTPKTVPSPCMIELKDEMVIHYDGVIYKCPGFIGWKGLEAGDIRSGVQSYGDTHNLKLWKNEECLNCAYLPLCFGGCRYMKLLRDGNFKDVDCKMEYLDATLETQIKQDVNYRGRKAESCK